MRLRAHELPPWSSVYLVEDTEDGPRREHVAEVCGRYGGGQQLLDVRTGDLCDWIDIDDDRRIEVSEIGMEMALLVLPSGGMDFGRGSGGHRDCPTLDSLIDRIERARRAA